MANFRPTDRLTSFLLPPSIDEWLPERHLARFVVEVIDQARPNGGGAVDGDATTWIVSGEP